MFFENTMSSRIVPAPSDARAFTDYRSSSQREAELRAMYGAPTETAYRHFLRHNGARVARDSRVFNLVPGATSGGGVVHARFV